MTSCRAMITTGRRLSVLGPCALGRPALQLLFDAAALAVGPAVRFGSLASPPPAQVFRRRTSQDRRPPVFLNLVVGIEACQQRIIEENLYCFHVDIIPTSPQHPPPKDDGRPSRLPF